MRNKCFLAITIVMAVFLTGIEYHNAYAEEETGVVQLEEQTATTTSDDTSPDSIVVPIGWKYLVPIKITEQSGQNLTDHQIQVTLDTSSLIAQEKLLSNAADLRFFTSKGKNLPYWIDESTMPGNSTKVWVKVSLIPSSSSTVIYMYYGKPNAQPGSNYERTMTYNDLQPRSSIFWKQRSSHALVVFHDKLWILGGYDQETSSSLNDVWSSDDGGNHWTRVTEHAPWTARGFHTALVFDDKIWVMGGATTNQISFNDVWYSNDGINWTQATSNASWLPRKGHASVVFDNRMWVIGGKENNTSLFNDVWYSSDGITWTQATSNAAWGVRMCPTLVSFNNKMWVIGGAQDFPTIIFYNDVWSSSDGITWTLEKQNAEWTPRYGHASVVKDNKIWVFGGMEEGPDRTNDVWSSYDGITWVEETPEAPWMVRVWFGAAVFEDDIFVVDGDNYTHDIWRSRDGVNWSQPPATVWFNYRFAHGAEVFHDQMWVLGGWSQSYPSPHLKNDIYSSPDGISWTEEVNEAPWSRRYDFGTVVLNNKMWIIGGMDANYNSLSDVWYTDDGLNWFEATHNAEWGYRSNVPVVSYNGRMWIFGGLDGAAMRSDVWSSEDGINWTRITNSAPWGRRAGHEAIVFDDKMWIIGGYVYQQGSKNDVWYSTDGINWTAATLNAPWEQRTGHSSVVYDNRMWVIGGNGNSPGLLNDAWYSTDGINWNLATTTTEMKGKQDFKSLVFQDNIWLLAGNTNIGIGFTNEVWRLSMRKQVSPEPLVVNGSEQLNQHSSEIDTIGEILEPLE